ncbi:MAG: hypothetical protein FD174_4015 [Geobacteraceae bacterium]|nr:MAG: hypothetical protein FD174_4015 [Geobacteraceae bacterium]
MRTLILIVTLLSLSTPLAAGSGKIPEKLTYDLTWTGIPVGSASQSITADGDTLHISALFKSNAWLSGFYPVENRIETTLVRKPDYFPGEVRQFRMRFREGSRVRDRSITFNHATNTAQYKDHLTNEKAIAAIRPGSADVMTAFYHARHLPIAPGDTISLPVMDGKEPYLLEVKVLRMEKLRTILGKVEALVVQPLVRPEGTFEGKRGITLWVTNDQRRIPVKMRTKVTVGSVTASLAAME